MGQVVYLTVMELNFASDDDWQISWAKEIGRRWDEIQSGQVQSIPGQPALARLREKLR